MGETMGHKVSILRSNEYEIDSLLKIFRESLRLIDFDVTSLKDKKILIKPNMLGAYPPDMGVTTHPIFVEAAIILFKELGCEVWVGDSPNGIFPIDSVWERTGIHEVCKRQGVTEKVFEREGSVIRDGILISKPVLEADAVVNLPKFKTHGLTVLTVAVKNLYGCVTGLKKTRYHKDIQDRIEFAKLLVRINQIVKPTLTIVDGIVGMDGNGPSAGRLVDLNMVLTGTNCHKVDEICADLVGLNPTDVDTLLAAQLLNVWSDAETIQTVGESINSCRPADFILPKTFTKGMRDWWISRVVIDCIWGGIHIKPKINKTKCQRCGLCVKSCPVEAIHEAEKKPPKIINAKCVECYCCHEICPHKAIDLNESLWIRIGRFIGERRIRKLNSNDQKQLRRNL